MLIVSGGSDGSSACIERAWRQPSRSTQRPIGTIRPVSSASGMNCVGGTRPRSGWCQRSSASTPETAAVGEAHDAAGSAARAGRWRSRAAGRRAARAARARPRASRARTAGSRPCRRAWRCTSRRRRCGSARRRRDGVALRRRRCRWLRDAASSLLLDRRAAAASDSRIALGGVGGVLRAARRPRAARRTRRRRSARRCRSARMLRVQALARPRRSTCVAGGVAEAVVDRLEVVEVQEDHGQRRRPRGARAATAWRTRSTNSARLARLGDRVVEGLVGELLLEGLALAHVAALSTMPRDVLVVEQVRVEDLELARAAVAVAQRALERPAVPRPACASPVGEHVQQARLLAAARAAGRSGVPTTSLGRVAEHPLDRRALVDDRCASASSTVMRSLECWTSEPKRASLARRWTSSVSAALSSASDDLGRQRAQRRAAAPAGRAARRRRRAGRASRRARESAQRRARATLVGEQQVGAASRSRRTLARCSPSRAAPSSATRGRGVDRASAALGRGVGGHDAQTSPSTQAERAADAVAPASAPSGVERGAVDLLAGAWRRPARRRRR